MEARAITTPPSNALPPGHRGATTAAEPNVGALVMGIFVLIVVIAAAIDAVLPKIMQRSFSLKAHAKVPCYRCQYFSDNPYIKCALHPVVVVTEQAVDCPDYRPNRMTKWVEK